jgi:hypothetical protein
MQTLRRNWKEIGTGDIISKEKVDVMDQIELSEMHASPTVKSRCYNLGIEDGSELFGREVRKNSSSFVAT